MNFCRRRLIDREIERDRIDGDNRGENRIAAPRIDQIALGQQCPADLTGDRGRNSRELEIEPSRSDLFHGGINLSRRIAHIRDRFVEILLRDGPGLNQQLITGDVLFQRRLSASMALAFASA